MHDNRRTLTYMSHLSDGALRNRIISQDNLRIALKLNLLFLDDIAMSAPALLRNHVLYNMMYESQQDRTALEFLVRNFFRPVLIEGNNDIYDVAKNITSVEKNKFIGLSGEYDLDSMNEQTPKIQDFGAFLNENIKEHRYIINKEYQRTEFPIILLGAIKNILNSAIPEKESTEALKELYRYVSNNNIATIKVADIYKWAENKKYPGQISEVINSLSFLSMEYSSAPINTCDFGVGGKAHNYIKEIITSQQKTAAQFGTNNYHDIKDDSFDITFPIDGILTLGYESIIKLRHFKFFEDIRHLLRSIRAGKPYSGKAGLKDTLMLLWKDMDQCVKEDLIKYAREELPAIERKMLIDFNRINQKYSSKFTIKITKNATQAIRVALVTFLQGIGWPVPASILQYSNTKEALNIPQNNTSAVSTQIISSSINYDLAKGHIYISR